MKYFELTSFNDDSPSFSVSFDDFIFSDNYGDIFINSNFDTDSIDRELFFYDRIEHWFPSESQSKIDTLTVEDFSKQELINIDFNSIKRVYPDGTVKLTVSDRPFNVAGRNEYPPELGVRSVLDRRRKVSERFSSPDQTKSEKSLERVRKKIFDLSMLNQWDWFLTLTLDKEKIDRTDVKAAGLKLRQWIHDHLTKKYPDLRYLVVYEQHKKSESNGKKAYHFHMLLSGVPDEAFSDSGTLMIKNHDRPIKWSTFNRLKELGHADESDYKCPVFNVPSFKLGFSTAIRIYQNGRSLAAYMTKYVTKDLLKTELPFGKAAYHRSRGNLVEEPDIYYGSYDVRKVPERAYKVSKEYGNYYFWDNVPEIKKQQLEMVVFAVHPRLISGLKRKQPEKIYLSDMSDCLRLLNKKNI